MVDEAGQKAVDYERYINRAGDEEIMDRWQNDNGVTITRYEDMDVDSFKNAVSGVAEWYQKELENQGYKDGKSRPGTLPVPQPRPVPGLRAAASSASSLKKQPAERSRSTYMRQTS